MHDAFNVLQYIAAAHFQQVMFPFQLRRWSVWPGLDG
jgi:hypothetical protein